MNASRKVRGATLLEVIAAVGILGFGFTAILGYTSSIAERLQSADELVDASLCESIRAFLQAQPFDAVLGWLDQPDRLRADRTGRIVATANDPIWAGSEGAVFAITLLRRAGESPAELDASAASVAFDLVVSGPGSGFRYPAATRR